MKQEGSVLNSIKILYDKFCICIEKKEEETAAELGREIRRLAITQGEEERNQYKLELFSVLNYLYKFHRNKHFQLKNKSNQPTAEAELSLAINYADDITREIPLPELIAACEATDFGIEKEPNDYYYQLILLSMKLGGNQFDLNIIPVSHRTTLYKLFIRESERCFKRKNNLWMNFLID